jgi:hypothetical protein
VQQGASLSVPAIRESSLSVSGNVNIPQDGTSAGTSKLGTISVTDGGKLDLSNNKLIVTNGSVGSFTGTSYEGVTGLLASGRNGGAWNGSGIVTSMTAAKSPNLLTTLAVATAGDVGKTSFGGMSVTSTDVLVMYTYTGDSNLTGKIDADDYFQIDSHYNKFANSAKSYYNGDFNYDGKINGDDYFLIDAAYAGQGSPISGSETMSGVTAVPEPASIALVAGAMGLGLRRRRSTR